MYSSFNNWNCMSCPQAFASHWSVFESSWQKLFQLPIQSRLVLSQSSRTSRVLYCHYQAEQASKTNQLHWQCKIWLPALCVFASLQHPQYTMNRLHVWKLEICMFQQLDSGRFSIFNPFWRTVVGWGLCSHPQGLKDEEPVQVEKH